MLVSWSSFWCCLYIVNTNEGEHDVAESAISFPPTRDRPPVSFVKLNWDAALNKDMRRMGIDQGGVVAAKAKWLPLLPDPTTTKALAIWEATKFCVDNGLEKVVLELVVNTLCQ